MARQQERPDDHTLQAIEVFLHHFVQPHRRERFWFLAQRGEFRSVFYHKLEPALDDRYTFALAGSEAFAPQVQSLLRVVTASDTAILIGGYQDEVGRSMPLEDALDACIGHDASLVLLDEGTVAYHEPEFKAGNHLIMTRDKEALARLRQL